MRAGVDQGLSPGRTGDPANAEHEPRPFLLRKAGQTFYITSQPDPKTLPGDQDDIAANLCGDVQACSADVRDIFERFGLSAQADRLTRAGFRCQVTEKLTQIGLPLTRGDNHQMGLVFEELIRRFSELSNETAGEHFLLREVIRLMVNLLFVKDDDMLSKPRAVRTI